METIYYFAIIIAILTAYRLFILFRTFNTTVKHKKGTHYWLRIPIIFPTFKRRLKARVIFTSKSEYTISNQGDSSKIIGLTYNNSISHHKNSIRVIWRYYNSKYNVGVRYYENGKPTNVFFDGIYSNGDVLNFDLEIIKGRLKCTFQANFETPQIFIKDVKYKKQFFFFRLFPYFGGSNPVTKDIEYKYYDNRN